MIGSALEWSCRCLAAAPLIPKTSFLRILDIYAQ